MVVSFTQPLQHGIIRDRHSFSLTCPSRLRAPATITDIIQPQASLISPSPRESSHWCGLNFLPDGTYVICCIAAVLCGVFVFNIGHWLRLCPTQLHWKHTMLLVFRWSPFDFLHSVVWWFLHFCIAAVLWGSFVINIGHWLHLCPTRLHWKHTMLLVFSWSPQDFLHSMMRWFLKPQMLRAIRWASKCRKGATGNAYSKPTGSDDVMTYISEFA